MKVIPWEDNQSLTDLQKDILVGCLLGDGRLECRAQSGTARFRVHHAESQREYLFWKYNNFQNLTHGAPWRTEWLDKRNGQVYGSWFFHTCTSPIFESFHKRFYREGTKIIPENIGNHLTSRALAVWIMDDGCRTRNEIILNTQSFTFDDQLRLLGEIHRLYNIKGTINRDRNNFRLRFGRIDAEKLSRIVEPHIIESLSAKIVPVSTVFGSTIQTGGCARVTKHELQSQHAGSRQ